MSTEKFAKFRIGQVIHHKKFDYRGIIIDIDPEFSGTDEWYDNVARSKPPKDKPWYHVIVEGSNTQTYVAERHLENDSTNQPINHPLVEAIFTNFNNGFYELRKKLN